LLDMQIPKNRQEVQRVLGIACFARNHIPDFALKTRALRSQTKKGAFSWSVECDKELAWLKSVMKDRIRLHIPDPSLPLLLDTDASEVGYGAMLYQVADVYSEQDVVRWADQPNDERKLPVLFLSKAFNAAMLNKPIYYQEGYALIMSIMKARHYADRSSFPLYVLTDHNPLRWIKTSHKGALSSWLLENVQDVDFKVVYMKGKWNTQADACSRCPVVQVNGKAVVYDVVSMLRLLQDMTKVMVHEQSPSRKRRKLDVVLFQPAEVVVCTTKALRSELPQYVIRNVSVGSLVKGHSGGEEMLLYPDPSMLIVLCKWLKTVEVPYILLVHLDLYGQVVQILPAETLTVLVMSKVAHVWLC
jgi:hypothetical protein